MASGTGSRRRLRSMYSRMSDESTAIMWAPRAERKPVSRLLPLTATRFSCITNSRTSAGMIRMKSKPYWEMKPKELAEATKSFDEPFVGDRSRPMNPAEREQWNRVSRKRGTPKLGQGFKRVSVSLDQGLLNRVTAFVKKRRISRSLLVAKVFEQALARIRNFGQL